MGRECVAESEQFTDKKVFVTDTYKKKMGEVAQFRRQQEYQDRLNEVMEVHKKGEEF